jgi:hypothetical protein
VLLAIYLDKDFIDVEGVTVTSVFSFQSTGINRSKLDAPEADRFTADGDSSFSEEVFYEWSGTPAVAVTTRLRLKR